MSNFEVSDRGGQAELERGKDRVQPSAVCPTSAERGIEIASCLGPRERRRAGRLHAVRRRPTPDRSLGPERARRIGRAHEVGTALGDPGVPHPRSDSLRDPKSLEPSRTSRRTQTRATCASNPKRSRIRKAFPGRNAGGYQRSTALEAPQALAAAVQAAPRWVRPDAVGIADAAGHRPHARMRAACCAATSQRGRTTKYAAARARPKRASRRAPRGMRGGRLRHQPPSEHRPRSRAGFGLRLVGGLPPDACARSRRIAARVERLAGACGGGGGVRHRAARGTRLRRRVGLVDRQTHGLISPRAWVDGVPGRDRDLARARGRRALATLAGPVRAA